ncbi:MAG: hydrogenase nickel incorporation protein HypB [Clostridiales bacterium]|nr:hydrogenase nickel incorporation protein HypB [Clostridiales bacterium]HBM81862.1 hydrogenase accessory protein HypB [Clostridiaceae bacterium]
MEIKVVRQIMEWNEDCNEELKAIFKENKVFVINLMGSPGAGKTTLITNMIGSLRHKFNIAVIEADIAGKIDAEKIGKMGIPVVQLNTEGACHIEAMSVKNIIKEFDLKKIDLILIENIGNLVCPAEFNIGEDLKVAMLSVPEGDDKAIKYPLMFTKAGCVIINKFDTVKYFNFDTDKVIKDINNVNPKAKVFKVSSLNGDGMDSVSSWIEKRVMEKIGS